MKNDLPRTTEIQFFEPKKEHFDFINSLLNNILEISGKREFYEILSFSLRELIQNAWNANLKFSIFRKHKLDISDFKDYIAGLKIFKELLETKEIEEAKKIILEGNYWIKFTSFLDLNGLRFEVINNSLLSPIEEKNLRLKLKFATVCADLIEYYTEGIYDPEDEKMGLAFIIFLLKKAKIPTELFRIGCVGNNTKARIEIPLSENYTPVRKILHKQSSFLYE